MSSLQIPRVMLSGSRAGAGKSLISIGLAVAFRKRNVSLSFCVNGSRPQQALILKRLTRRNVRSLDFNLLTSSQTLSGIRQASVGADLLLIEGQAGLFDGVGAGSLKGSDAELALLSRTPVILIADAKGLGSSLAALIKGYAAFTQGFSLAGCIANFCNFHPTSEEFNAALGDSLRDKIYYDSALQTFGMNPLLGAVPQVNQSFPKIIDKFTQLEGSVSLPLQFFKEVGNLIEQHINLEALVDIANSAPELKLPESVHEPANRRTKIAVSDDTCFNLGFQDNIDLMKYHGAEISIFSPLADEDLPKGIGAIYLTGASIDSYAEDLEKNQNIQNSIRSFVETGGVVFSEGAGTAYLCEQFEGSEPGTFFQGVGIIKGRAVKDASYFKYNESILTEDSILGRAGTVFKGVSLGEWRLESKVPVSKVIRISNGASSTFEEGYSPEAQIVSTFTFPHFGSSPEIAKNLVDSSEIVLKL